MLAEGRQYPPSVGLLFTGGGKTDSTGKAEVFNACVYCPFLKQSFCSQLT